LTKVLRVVYTPLRRGVYTVKRKQIHIEPEIEYKVKELAERRGVSESYVIREAIAAYLAGEKADEAENPLLGIIGIVSNPDAPTDGSINHDHYLYGAPRESTHRDRGKPVGNRSRKPRVR
jgi:hypothetical protein